VVPSAVLSVAHAGDVAHAVGWAHDQGVPFSVRGGGHSYTGSSVCPGLVLDLRGLREVHVDPRTGLATVGGGACMADLTAVLQRHGLMFPIGNSDDVGIGGLVLGGGVAAVSRVYGLTCDSLRSTDVVLADGSTVTADDTEHSDLFWACRGGGGGNFGVNTSFTFQTRPVSDVSTCVLLWRWTHAVEVMVAAQELMTHAPDELATRIGASRSVDFGGVVSLVGQHLGPADELRELLAPVISVAEPERVDIADRGFWEAQQYLRHETSADAFAVRTRFTRRPLPPEAVLAAIGTVDKWPGSTNPDGAGFALFSWGGAINRTPAGATAFPHRDTLFLVSMDTSWSGNDPADVVSANLGWLDALYDEMAGWATDAAYVNFPDAALIDWGTAYYGSNFARLVDVKRRYDPDGVFRSPQPVG
jgi:FAD/FMN-containing dehydrogenase